MEMKEAYQEKADAQLREWLVWIEQYKHDPDWARPVDRQRMTERLEDSHRIACVRLDELRSSQDERWEFAKQAVERAMIDLKHVLDESGAAQAGKLIKLQPSRAHVYQPFHRKG